MSDQMPKRSSRNCSVTSSHSHDIEARWHPRNNRKESIPFRSPAMYESFRLSLFFSCPTSIADPLASISVLRTDICLDKTESPRNIRATNRGRYVGVEMMAALLTWPGCAVMVARTEHTLYLNYSNLRQANESAAQTASRRQDVKAEASRTSIFLYVYLCMYKYLCIFIHIHIHDTTCLVFWKPLSSVLQPRNSPPWLTSFFSTNLCLLLYFLSSFYLLSLSFSFFALVYAHFSFIDFSFS